MTRASRLHASAVRGALVALGVLLTTWACVYTPDQDARGHFGGTAAWVEHKAPFLCTWDRATEMRCEARWWYAAGVGETPRWQASREGQLLDLAEGWNVYLRTSPLAGPVLVVVTGRHGGHAYVYYAELTARG